MEQCDRSVNDDELRRPRELSRAFLPHLRTAARLRAEYDLALKELAAQSHIVRHWAEDDLQEDLHAAIGALVERCPDPLRIESAISEADAFDVLNREGAFADGGEDDRR